MGHKLPIHHRSRNFRKSCSHTIIFKLFTMMMAPIRAAARASVLLVFSTAASFQAVRTSYPLRAATSSRLLNSFSGDNNDNNNFSNNNLVSSTKSNTVKKIQQLLTKRKKRTEFQETVVEGPRMVFDLLADRKTRALVKQVIISTEKWQDYQEEWHAAWEKSESNNNQDGDGEQEESLFPPTVVPGTPEVLKACTDTVANQGIVAIVGIPSFPLVGLAATEQSDENNGATAPLAPASSSLYLILDGVADPGNLGTLLRSSLATAVTGVILLPGSCDPWNPKAVRSAMGTSFRIPIVAVDSWVECCDLLSDLSCHRTYAATMLEDRQGTSHYQVDWTSEPTALIIGSEGNGLSEDVRKALALQDDKNGSSIRIQPVHVPMQAGVESLNAAICGSVILFECLRQVSK
jgi:TrmH family RNA methyltransferase